MLKSLKIDYEKQSQSKQNISKEPQQLEQSNIKISQIP